MSQRAQKLAERFVAANEELIRTIESCSEADLDSITTGEEWPVRVAAHHVAVSHEPVAGLAQLIATGQPLPSLTLEDFHHGNAQHAAEHATVSKAAIIEQLKRGGAKAQEIVLGLNNDALDSSSNFPLFGGDVTAEWIIENVLIGHVNVHMASIKNVLGN